MSASREKKTRQDLGTDYQSPKAQKARQEALEARRATVIFTICAVAFVAFVAAMFVWNSNIIQRNAAAVSINGTTYSAADVAFYYYNGRSTLLNSYGSLIDSGKSLREQNYADDETWYDYLSETAMNTLASAAALSQAAKDAGYDGGEELDKTVSDSIATFQANAAASGYSFNQYLTAVYGPLMTRSVFERNLRMSTLASLYTDSISAADRFSEDELTAAYDADPSAYQMSSYEAVTFYSSSFTEETAEDATEEEKDAAAAAGLAAAQVNAEALLQRYQNGEDLAALAAETDGTYVSSVAYGGSTSDLVTWLFDDARRDGDSTVLDYYGMGSMVVVFHDKSLADYHTVSVRHILVDDEAAANDLLAQFNAGDQTEDAFAALATENSTDSGSAQNGGLYSDVRKGQMTKDFDNWCFDTSRQPGDTGIVKTDYGYHVMYFVETASQPYWKVLAASKLANDAVGAITDGLEPAALDGMKYIDA